MTVLEDSLLDFFDFCIDLVRNSYCIRLVIADYSTKEQEEWDSHSENFDTLDMCEVLAFLTSCVEYYRRGYIDWEEDSIDDEDTNILRMYRTHAQRE